MESEELVAGSDVSTVGPVEIGGPDVGCDVPIDGLVAERVVELTVGWFAGLAILSTPVELTAVAEQAGELRSIELFAVLAFRSGSTVEESFKVETKKN